MILLVNGEPSADGKEVQRRLSVKGRARANLGDTMYTPGGVADLGVRILKWPKSDEKL